MVDDAFSEAAAGGLESNMVLTETGLEVNMSVNVLKMPPSPPLDDLVLDLRDFGLC